MKKYFTLDDWITLLQKSGKEGGRIFSPEILRTLSGLNMVAVKKAIQRLGAKGYLVKLKGKYYGYRSMNITGNLRAIYKFRNEYDCIFVTIDTHSNLYS